MQWNKAGRPRKQGAGDDRKPVSHEDRPWTRREMRIHTDAVRGLAHAVIRQWLDDGKPAQDSETIKLWCSIIAMGLKHDDEKNRGQDTLNFYKVYREICRG